MRKVPYWPVDPLVVVVAVLQGYFVAPCFHSVQSIFSCSHSQHNPNQQTYHTQKEETRKWPEMTTEKWKWPLQVIFVFSHSFDLTKVVISISTQKKPQNQNGVDDFKVNQMWWKNSKKSKTYRLLGAPRRRSLIRLKIRERWCSLMLDRGAFSKSASDSANNWFSVYP